MVNSPRDAIRQAYKQELIEYDQEWIEVMKNRNLTVHTYNEELAEEIYGKLPEALKLFEELLKKLSK